MNSIRLVSRSLISRSLVSPSVRFVKPFAKPVPRFNQTSAAVQAPKKLKERNGEKNGTIYITESAINRLKRVLAGDEALRVSVDSGGCKGFNYLFKVEQLVDQQDKVFEVDSSKILIDPESYEFLKDSILDYNDELIKSTFLVKDNPQNSDSCSCGISFSPKIFWPVELWISWRHNCDSHN